MFSRGVRIILISAVALAAIVAGTAIAMLSGDAIYPGIRVAGVDMGGLTIPQAEERLAPQADQVAQVTVLLKHAGRSWPATVAQLGGSMDITACVRAAHRIGREGSMPERVWQATTARRHGTDVPVVYAYDREAAEAHLRGVAQSINRTPTNARVELNDGLIRIIPEKPGIEVNASKSLAVAKKAVDSGQDEAELVVVTAMPEVTSADLKGIEEVISSYSTQYNPSQVDRTHNLRLACKSINGTLVKAGEVFSYNKTVGARERSRGYRAAPMFVRGEVEQGTGGGVCQISTTVYNAALLANMSVVARSHHSRPVVYAPVGRDATVAYPKPDLQFRNTTGTPVYILASVGGGTARVAMLGKKPEGQEVEVVTSGHQVIKARTITRTKDELEPGKEVVRESGRNGHRVSVYRIVRSGGEIVKREMISSDYYSPENRVIEVGPAPSDPPDQILRSGLDNPGPLAYNKCLQVPG